MYVIRLEYKEKAVDVFITNAERSVLTGQYCIWCIRNEFNECTVCAADQIAVYFDARFAGNCGHALRAAIKKTGSAADRALYAMAKPFTGNVPKKRWRIVR